MRHPTKHLRLFLTSLAVAGLLAFAGVVGTAVGLGPNGDPGVKIYTATHDGREANV